MHSIVEIVEFLKLENMGLKFAPVQHFLLFKDMRNVDSYYIKH